MKRGYDYVGTDISAGLLAEAKKNLPGHRFLKQSVYELSFKEKFDGFWASAVLLHVPRRRMDEALTALRSVIKDGGIGYISIKNGSGEKMIPEGENGRFFSFWSKDGFSAKLRGNGFEMKSFIHDPRSPTDDWLCFFVQAR